MSEELSPEDREIQARLVAKPSEATLAWAASQVSSDAFVKGEPQPMRGAWAHAMHAINISDPRGFTSSLVLRRYVRSENFVDPEVNSAKEVAALEALSLADIPVPIVRAADVEGAVCDAPTILMTRVAGRPPDVNELPEMFASIAEMLRRVHRIRDEDLEALLPPFRPYFLRESSTLGGWPGDGRNAELWDALVERIREPLPERPSVFIHRDFHYGNVLRHMGKLSGIVDWAMASWGPAEQDVAHMRWNLAAHAKREPELADAFLEECLATGVISDWDPLWDLYTIADTMGQFDPNDPEDRALLPFTEQLLESVLAD